MQRDLNRHLMQSWAPASQKNIPRRIKSLPELGDMVTTEWSACLPVSAGVLARSASAQECAKARRHFVMRKGSVTTF